MRAAPSRRRASMSFVPKLIAIRPSGRSGVTLFLRRFRRGGNRRALGLYKRPMGGKYSQRRVRMRTDLVSAARLLALSAALAALASCGGGGMGNENSGQAAPVPTV